MKPRVRFKITVGLSSCGIAAGAEAVANAFRREIVARGLDAAVEITGCVGMCHREVLAEVAPAGGGTFLYGDLTADRVPRIAHEHLANGVPVGEWLVLPEGSDLRSLPYFAGQRKIVLANCGFVDPEKIGDSIRRGGYAGLAAALETIRPDDLIHLVEESGLRGRGGAGFPTAKKWRAARNAPGTEKYLICNADEGDPGAFMDRSVLESDPHTVLEGMAIAAYAIGASRGIVYVRAEYPLAVKRLAIAVRQAERRGFLGADILGSGFDFTVSLMEGAGAFVCGEETALIRSIQGERGMPRLRPPFPPERGLWGKPTCINNVETLAAVPWIVRHGAAAYAAVGTAGSRGTKVFALAGKVNRGGLVEVPMGTTLREIVLGIGGGAPGGRPVKAIQIGGPSGGCLPEALFDTPVDYESLQESGAIMGSGGMIVLDESSCMVEIARYFLSFTQAESCGKCTFCRIGTKRMLEILNRIAGGTGRMEDLDLLEELAGKVKTASLCGLGQTAPNPVLTTLRFFRSEYEAHIRDRRCPAKRCKALIRYEISAETCIGCGACLRLCPAKAIEGEPKRLHRIDPARCTRCGLCVEACKFGAVAAE
ncbi:MAG TPA: NADH-ubiquinone oxidoreductase-F iron-sulfur binding region domain-containing protein [bacterium]|nr:NADH-ubiquinone oxidoreductase-F iron-sulfur binding region domain-containing protein [bacterium]